jgi:hypothetical protein
MPPRRKRVQTGFRWNDALGRYIAPNGKIVSKNDVRLAIDVAIDNAERRMTKLAVDLRNGDITGAAFYRDMRRSVKQVHLYNAAAAKGGWAQLTPSDFGRVGQRVRYHYAHLNQLAADIAAGLPLDGRFENRVGMYAQAGRSTYHRTERADMIDRGFTLERNVLHKAEHCDGCLIETSRGWVPLGELVIVGERDCLTRCKCTIEHR